MNPDFLLQSIKIVLESVASSPFGYVINIDGDFLKGSGNNYIAAKLHNGKLVFGKIQSVPLPDDGKKVNTFMESHDAKQFVLERSFNTVINTNSYEEYVNVEQGITVDFSTAFSCLVIKTAVYNLGLKLLNHQGSATLAFSNKQVTMPLATVERFKIDFADLIMDNFRNSWDRYNNKINRAISSAQASYRYPYAFSVVPNFRLMGFEFISEDPLKAKIINPFFVIPNSAKLLKESKMWEYMEQNSIELEYKGDLIRCYFVSSIEFCKAMNLKNHIQFPKKKTHTDNYYNLFFGTIYDRKFYNSNRVVYLCNSQDYLKTNPNAKSRISVEEFLLLDSVDREFYSAYSSLQLVARDMANLLPGNASFTAKEAKLFQMISPFTLLPKES